MEQTPQIKALVDLIERVHKDTAPFALCVMYKVEEVGLIKIDMIGGLDKGFEFRKDTLRYIEKIPEGQASKEIKLVDNFLIYHTSDLDDEGIAKLKDGVAIGIYFKTESFEEAPYLTEEFIENLPYSNNSGLIYRDWIRLHAGNKGDD